VTYATWDDFYKELNCWAETGHVATFWWRDDDCVQRTAQLDTLLAVANGHPLSLAVIPGMAEYELSLHIKSFPNVSVLQHGWRHINRQLSPGSPSEFPPHRSVEAVEAEIVDRRLFRRIGIAGFCSASSRVRA